CSVARWAIICVFCCVMATLSPAGAATVTVRDSAALRKAVEAAQPGDRILLAPGEYQGGMNFRDLHGRPGALIAIAGADRKQPPVIRGGGNNFQFSDVTYLELRDLALTGGTGNGLNIDDGGTFET